jgi:hypothetical protein
MINKTCSVENTAVGKRVNDIHSLSVPENCKHGFVILISHHITFWPFAFSALLGFRDNDKKNSGVLKIFRSLQLHKPWQYDLAFPGKLVSTNYKNVKNYEKS